MLLVLGFAVPVVTAQADSLDTARVQGVVGERYDGLAVVRDKNASAAIRNMVTDINGQRQKLYDERAASEGAPVDQVGRVYARQIFQSVPSGTWFLQENGQWVQK
jgi:uncharacterized protein YdbL (DUF1318 family)